MGKRRAARIRGRGAEAEGVSGVSGREARGSGGRWRPYPLAGFTAGEGVRRQRAPVPTRSGEQGRGEGGEVGWAGVGARVAAQFGPGFGPDGPRVQWGGEGPSPYFFFSFVCSVFCFLFICLFSFLFYFI